MGPVTQSVFAFFNRLVGIKFGIMKSIYPRGAIVFILLGILLACPPASAFAQAKSQGPFCGKIYSSDASNNGALYWVNAAGARCDEDATRAATDRIRQGQHSQYLRISDFGFDIPRDARISGIEVVVIRRSDHQGSLRDKSVRLVRNGVVTGSNKAVPEMWDSEWTAVYYGSETDKWGGNWTPYELNRRDFGIVLDVTFAADEGQPQVDEVVVTVHYTPKGQNVHAVNVVGSSSKFTCFKLGS